MSDVFKLRFNGMTLTYPGWNGYVAIDNPNRTPYLLFEFSVPSFEPTKSLLNSKYNFYGEWKRVSSSPNVWKLEIRCFVTGDTPEYGLPFLFSDANGAAPKLISTNLGGGTCRLIGSGNMDLDNYGHYCKSFDRMFYNCTGLTYIEPIHCAGVENVGGMFNGCENVEDGAYDQYVWFSTYALNVSNHSSTFTDCGSATQTGLADLDQIPVGWGGNLVPASTLMTSSRVAYTGSNYTAWTITGNAPDWTNIIGMYLFTEASVAKYAGVSMNRSRIPNPLNGLGTAQASYALYFYPAFVQCTKIPGTSGNSVSWLATTDSPNGHLDVGQGNTDMPGTLDYSTYGPFTREYGTYDSTQDVYFVFLVTNVPIAQWGGLTDAMGFLYSSYFNEDGGFRYFF